MRADLRGMLAGHEIPVLRPEDARYRLGRHQAGLQAPAQVRRRLPGRLRHLQRDDRRAQRLAHRRQRAGRAGSRRAADDLPDALSRFRDGVRTRIYLPDRPYLSRRPGRQGMAQAQGRATMSSPSTARSQGRRELLDAPQQPPQRIRHRPGRRPNRTPRPRARATSGSRPSPRSSTIKYNEWVKNNRDYVDKTVERPDRLRPYPVA